MIEQILTIDKNFIIDNGAGGFLAISNYIIEHNIISVLSEFDVFVHIPITGGQAFTETVKGLVNISKQFDEKTNIILWINEYFGKLEKEIEEFKFYKKADHSKIKAKIKIVEQSADTFGEDIKGMFTAHKTFNEIAKDEDLKFMVKRRLDIFKNQVFDQLTKAKLCA